jgi:hypothetical protein
MMIKAMTKWPKNLVTADSFIVKEDPEFEKTKSEFLVSVRSIFESRQF